MSKQIRVVSVGFHKNQPYLCEIKCHKDEQERPVVDGFRFLDASKVFNDDWKANLLALIGDDHAVAAASFMSSYAAKLRRKTYSSL
ncbi:hypothetical protein DBT82_RS16900 [Vibrio parahaemolyticus]|uniref:hypothetical protein n=1 Tax=Vibrio parahaemolyticus TaxID=670 RepID=UPI0011118942|nr:hypothetical protein [Vibrio parahaemolyticus]EGQ8284293.1 hypothetical protein [Vibrio parahaemolyticus]EGQ8333985.1 hypothetical protein [Vibrio parahaemolyticus]EJG0031755.1 hypothetical protein [Vibrio parahaemolyticus]EJG0226382.1 hypothetical protein [Vibrio parahaemolyticus]EJG0350010.1 hypothetical protein [Vibrio parahaemolyticus]